MKNKKLFRIGLLMMILFSLTFIFVSCVGLPLSEPIDFPINGRWIMTGGQTVSQSFHDYSGSIIVIEEINGNNFSGYIDFYYNNEYWAREYVGGTFDPRSRRITLEGYRLDNIIAIPGWNKVLSRYEAILSRDNRNFESGTSRGGTNWFARFQN